MARKNALDGEGYISEDAEMPDGEYVEASPQLADAEADFDTRAPQAADFDAQAEQAADESIAAVPANMYRKQLTELEPGFDRYSIILVRRGGSRVIADMVVSFGEHGQLPAIHRSPVISWVGDAVTAESLGDAGYSKPRPVIWNSLTDELSEPR